MDASPEATGAAAITAAAIGLAVQRRFWSDETGIQDLIEQASSSDALTYREAREPLPVEAAQRADSPEEMLAREQRRRTVLARTQQMLTIARENVEEELVEATKDGDSENIAHCNALLEKLAPLPDGVVIDANIPPDYKRWLDDGRL
jgi:hypothetical protein